LFFAFTPREETNQGDLWKPKDYKHDWNKCTVSAVIVGNQAKTDSDQYERDREGEDLPTLPERPSENGSQNKSPDNRSKERSEEQDRKHWTNLFSQDSMQGHLQQLPAYRNS
jgi:hypothetical protein